MGQSGRPLWPGTTGPLRPGSSTEDMTVPGGEEDAQRARGGGGGSVAREASLSWGSEKGAGKGKEPKEGPGGRTG